MLKYLEMQEKAQKTKKFLPTSEKKEKDQFVQFTTVDVKFVMSGMYEIFYIISLIQYFTWNAH